jgi:hypothetical protein
MIHVRFMKITENKIAKRSSGFGKECLISNISNSVRSVLSEAAEQEKVLYMISNR